jgi:hypothetical protein
MPKRTGSEDNKMILDGYWKKELKRNLRNLKLWINLSKAYSVYSKYSEHQVNKSILYSAIIIRKMFEDEKHAEPILKEMKALELEKHTEFVPKIAHCDSGLLKIIKYKVSVTIYPFSGDEDFIIERVIPDNYDYKNKAQEKIELNKLCNQIIHSFVWSVAYEQKSKKIHGVLFASDKEKAKVMYLLEPKEWIKAIRFCIKNGNI